MRLHNRAAHVLEWIIITVVVIMGEKDFDNEIMECFDRDGTKFTMYVKAFIQALLTSHERTVRDKVKMLIVDEINTARSENEKTSRLTSLYNKFVSKE